MTIIGWETYEALNTGLLKAWINTLRNNQQKPPKIIHLIQQTKNLQLNMTVAWMDVPNFIVLFGFSLLFWFYFNPNPIHMHFSSEIVDFTTSNIHLANPRGHLNVEASCKGILTHFTLHYFNTLQLVAELLTLFLPIITVSLKFNEDQGSDYIPSD